MIAHNVYLCSSTNIFIKKGIAFYKFVISVTLFSKVQNFFCQKFQRKWNKMMLLYKTYLSFNIKNTVYIYKIKSIISVKTFQFYVPILNNTYWKVCVWCHYFKVTHKPSKKQPLLFKKLVKNYLLLYSPLFVCL